MQVEAGGRAPGEYVRRAMQGHRGDRRQEPGPGATVGSVEGGGAPHADDQQSGGNKVEGCRDENDCHRRSVA